MSFARNRSCFRVRLCSGPVVLFTAPFPAARLLSVARYSLSFRGAYSCAGNAIDVSGTSHAVLYRIYASRYYLSASPDIDFPTAALLYADLLYYAYCGNCLAHYSKNRLGLKSVLIHEDCAEDEEFREEE